MARRQRHLVDLADVPSGDDMPPRMRIAEEAVDQEPDLVDSPAFRSRPGAPLLAVNRAEFALRVLPLVPDRHAVFLEIAGVRFPAEKPQQLVDDRAPYRELTKGLREGNDCL